MTERVVGRGGPVSQDRTTLSEPKEVAAWGPCQRGWSQEESRSARTGRRCLSLKKWLLEARDREGGRKRRDGQSGQDDAV